MPEDNRMAMRENIQNVLGVYDAWMLMVHYKLQIANRMPLQMTSGNMDTTSVQMVVYLKVNVRYGVK